MSKFEEFCKVDGPKVRAMCLERGTRVKEVAEKLGMSGTCLYVWLQKGKMPSKVAHQMMDIIWDGCPPFYFDAEIKKAHSGSKTVYPSYYSNLLEARLQIDIAIKKIQEMEEVKDNG